MFSKPVVSCIITTYNRKNLLKRCLISIINQEYKKYEIIVIDDASTDGTYKFLQEFKRNLEKDQNINITIIRNKTPKFVAESRNIGAKFARGKYLFFIDDDVELDKNCVKELIDFMETHPEFVASTPLIYDTKGKVWNVGVRRAYLGFNFSYSLPSQEKKYIAVDECITAYVVRREDFEKIGGYNSRFKFYYEESEMFYRLKKVTNKKIACVLRAKAYHHIEENKLWKIPPFKAYLLGRNRIWFYKEWCNSTVHYILCVLTWMILCDTFYLMNFIKSRNLKAFKSLIRGIKDGLLTSL